MTEGIPRLFSLYARFEIRDLTDYDQTAEEDSFDFVTTFDAIHDQAKPLNLLKGIRRTLKADGNYLARDIHASSHHHDREHPLGPCSTRFR